MDDNDDLGLARSNANGSVSPIHKWIEDNANKYVFFTTCTRAITIFGRHMKMENMQVYQC